MSDARLRELERRWRASGAVEDEACYLQELVRVGGLARERVELAAFFGHPGALLAVGASAPRAGDLRKWLSGAPHGGHVVLWRAALAAVEVAGSAATVRVLAESADLELAGRPTPADHGLAGPPTPSPEALLRRVATWLVAPNTGFQASQEQAYWATECWPGVPYAIVGEAAQLAGRELVRTAICCELAEWALGRRDAVLERLG